MQFSIESTVAGRLDAMMYAFSGARIGFHTSQWMIIPRRWLGQVVLVLVMASCSSISSAFEVSADGSYEVGINYNDNLRLRESREIETTRVRNYAETDLRVEDAKSIVSFAPYVEFLNFSESKVADSTSWGGTTSAQRRFGKLTLSALVSYDLDENNTINEATDPLVVVNEQIENTWSGQVSGAYQISRQTLAQISGFFTEVVFDQSSAFGQVDYDYIGGNLTMTHEYDDRTTISPSLAANRFRTPLTGGTTTSVSANLRIRRLLTDTLFVEASAGVIQSDIEFVGRNTAIVDVLQLISLLNSQQIAPGQFFAVESGDFLVDFGPVADTASDTDYNLSAQVTKEFERQKLTLRFDRSTSPSTDGNQRVTSTFKADYTYRQSETLRYTAGFTYSDLSSQANLQESLDREFRNARAAVSWEFARDMFLEAQYVNLHRKFTQRSQSASFSMFGVGLRLESLRGVSNTLRTFYD